MEYMVYEFKLDDIQAGRKAAQYVTESSNDAWNWVLTSASPTNLVVLNSAGRPERPPVWFTNQVDNYEAVDFREVIAGRRI
jgi:type VI protein secretion system component Hcp